MSSFPWWPHGFQAIADEDPAALAMEEIKHKANPGEVG